MLTKDALLNRLFQSKIVQDEIAAAELELDRQRQDASDEIERLELEAARELPKLHAAAEAARERAVKLAAEAQSAKRAFMIAELASVNAATVVESAIGHQRSFLHETAPPVIGEYLSELLSMSNLIRAEHIPFESGPRPSYDPFRMDGGTATLAARHARHLEELQLCELIRDTIESVKSMLIRPVSEAQASAEIASHRSCISSAMTRAGINLN